MMQGYLEDPSVSFCGIDDTLDRAPLQVTDFGQGVQIDQLISKIYLESGGKGDIMGHEAYELSAFFYLQQCELENVALPYFFITGDEHFYQRIKKQTIKKIMGDVSSEIKKENKEEKKEEESFFSRIKNFFGTSNNEIKEIKKENYETELKEDEISSLEIFKALKKKFNVFHLHKPYSQHKLHKGELDDWIEALGEDWILELKSPKAVIDVILGVIALTSGSRTMEAYAKDMKDRGQSAERIEEVMYSLRHLTPKFLKKNIVRFKPKPVSEILAKDKGNLNTEKEKKEEKKEEI